MGAQIAEQQMAGHLDLLGHTSSDNVLGISGGIPLPILSKACVFKTGEI